MSDCKQCAALQKRLGDVVYTLALTEENRVHWREEYAALQSRLDAAAENMESAMIRAHNRATRAEKWAKLWRRCAKANRRRILHNTGVYPRSTKAWEKAWGYTVTTEARAELLERGEK
jgi:hypothetical protein